jgi:hypothetical protein
MPRPNVDAFAADLREAIATVAEAAPQRAEGAPSRSTTLKSSSRLRWRSGCPQVGGSFAKRL